jgi:glycosyltransferase involved in cell wall biosynthesis
MKYVVVTPARNEAEFIGFTIESVVNQSLKPVEWIIVDDGSSDDTFKIASDYASRHSWIRVYHHETRDEQRSGGAKVVRAFNFGYSRLSEKEYDFIVKMDGDIQLPEDYFEAISDEFIKDPKLGICGGVILNKFGNDLIQEGEMDYHVRGAFKAIRKETFERIGGFKPIWNWDGIDEMEALYYGWKTKCIPKYVIHFRPTSAAYDPVIHAYKCGYEAYRMRNSFLLTLLRTLYRIPKKPFFINSISYIRGYLTSLFKRESRHITPDLARFINRFHWNRILRKYFKIA